MLLSREPCLSLLNIFTLIVAEKSQLLHFVIDILYSSCPGLITLSLFHTTQSQIIHCFALLSVLTLSSHRSSSSRVGINLLLYCP